MLNLWRASTTESQSQFRILQHPNFCVKQYSHHEHVLKLNANILVTDLSSSATYYLLEQGTER
jgi:hypothetical protein